MNKNTHILCSNPYSTIQRALADGGVAARAAQAGDFSDAKVLTAMDLLASQFSDNSISPKTKAMRAEVETLREVVQGLNKAARLGSGEDQAKSGLFGGSKGPSQQELKKQVQELYLKGGNAYNQESPRLYRFSM